MKLTKPIQIYEPLPLTTCDQSGQLQLEHYLSRNRISQEHSRVLIAYQNAETDGYLAAARLNHCLTVERYGEYTIDCYDYHGDLELSQPSFDNSKRDLDNVFDARSYSFTDDSVLFKGIGIEPFYEFLELPSRPVGDLVHFAGFLSATVCPHVAQTFARGAIVKFRGLNNWRGIVPPTNAVRMSKTPGGVEQEILLDRGSTVRILSRSTLNGHPEIEAEFICAEK
jgi:hypothetical protein